MKILILTNQQDQARLLIEKLNLDNPLVWDESIINEGVQVHPNDVNYTSLTVKRAANLVLNYRAKRPLVVILDMLRWPAVENIQHDISILLYDNTKKRRLFFNTNYNVDYKISKINDPCIGQIIQQLTKIKK